MEGCHGGSTCIKKTIFYMFCGEVYRKWWFSIHIGGMCIGNGGFITQRLSPLKSSINYLAWGVVVDDPAKLAAECRYISSQWLVPTLMNINAMAFYKTNHGNLCR